MLLIQDIKNSKHLYLIIIILSFLIAISLYISVNLSIITISALSLLLVLIIKPVWSLYLIVIVIPLSNALPNWFPFDRRISGLNEENIIIGLSVIAYVVHSIAIKKSLKIVYSKLNISIIILISLIIISIYIGLQNLQEKSWFGSYYLALKWLEHIFLYFIILQILNDREHIRRIVFLTQVMLLFMGAVFLIKILNQIPHIKYLRAIIEFNIRQEMVSRIFTGSNELAALFAIYSPISLVIFFGSKRPWFRILYLSVFLTSLVSLFATFSRSGLAVISIGIATIGALFDKRLLVILLILVLLAPIWLPNLVKERIASTFEPKKSDDLFDPASMTRLSLWRGAWKMFCDKPILGFGSDAFRYLGKKYTGLHENWDVHSGLFYVLTSMGILGLLSLVFFLYFAFKMAFGAYKCSKEKKDNELRMLSVGVIAMLFAFIITNLLLTAIHYGPHIGYFWILLGCLQKDCIISSRLNQ